MPRRVAETDAFKQIEDSTGSGPFIFKKDEFKPGEKAVYLKNPRYLPRKEPPSGSTGGKVVHFDRVEWNLALRDPQTQVNALVRGETDLIEQVAFEQYEAVKANKDLRVFFYTPLGRQYMARFNHLHKPFDNPAVRRAAIAAFSQEPFLRAQVGSKDLYSACASMFTCGTPYSNTAGSEIQSKSNLKRAQELLKASGYDGTPVVLLKPTDIYSINKLPDVGAQLLRQAGFKVDLQAMDWQTLVGRRAKKDAPDKGGWNLIFAAWDSPDIWNPINNAALDARGEKSTWVGWPKDERLEALRAQFLREIDDAKKKKLAAAIQARAFEIGTHAPIGEYRQPGAMAKNISGIVVGPGNFYWNVRKN
jgi:peptide/nickel transport system substrate-binding protein